MSDWWAGYVGVMTGLLLTGNFSPCVGVPLVLGGVLFYVGIKP